MATIALYSGKISQMPGLIQNVKTAVINLKSDLSELQKKANKVDASVCDLGDVISSIQASTQIQEDRVTELETFHTNSEDFITDAVRIDDNAAETVNQEKKNFYEKYTYLKPDCETSEWEKFCECLESVGEWCKEHWKEILIGLACIVVGALLTFLTGGSFLAALLLGLKTALIFAAISGGISAGLTIVGSILSGDSIGTVLGKGVRAFFDAAPRGFMSGGIFSGFSFATGALSTFHTTRAFFEAAAPAIHELATITKTVSLTLNGVDVISSVWSIFNQDNPLTGLLTELDQDSSYSTMRDAVNIMSLIFGGASNGYDNRWYEPQMVRDPERGTQHPEMRIKWPTEANNAFNDGFAQAPEEITLEPGTILQRRGPDTGRFVAPYGTPEDSLSMAPGSENGSFYIYEVTEPVTVLSGPAASWFDKPGGGIQYKLPSGVGSMPQLSQLYENIGSGSNPLLSIGDKIGNIIDSLLGGGYAPVASGGE